MRRWSSALIGAGACLAFGATSPLGAQSAPETVPPPVPGYSAKWSPERIKALTALPDWSGTWKVIGTVALLDDSTKRMFQRGLRDRAPMKPEWAARYEADARRAEDQGNMESANPIVDSHTIYCNAGLPRLIATPFDYQFFVTPGRTLIMVGGAGGEARTIYTDGRAFPPADEMWPKFWGWSIGKWEGDTLVIETRGLKPGLWADPTPMVLSDKAVIFERLRRTSAGVIENQVTIVDPVALTEPWKFTRGYKLLDSNEWADEHEVCGGPEDRNPIVDGRVTVVMPKQPQ